MPEKKTNLYKEAGVSARKIFDTLGEMLIRGEVVAIPKFGIFQVNESPARIGRNPKTGEVLKIPSKKRISFRPSKNLKTKIRSDSDD